MVGGDEVAADGQREGQHGAGLDVVGIVAEGAYQGAQVLHSPVVDAPQTSGHRLLAAGPVAHREVDGQQVLGEGEHARLAHLGPRVATFGFDTIEYLIGAPVLPRIEQRIEEHSPALEVPVEAAAGHPERLGEQVHSHRVGSPDASAVRPASIHVLRGVRVWATMILQVGRGA